MHDVAVQHDKIRREPGREPSTRVLREGRIGRVVRHAPQSLRARQRLGGVPVMAWRCAREKGDEDKQAMPSMVVWNREPCASFSVGRARLGAMQMDAAQYGEGNAAHRKDGEHWYAPTAWTVWRRAVGAAPRDGRVESQERVDTLNGKVRAERETFPWRGPT